MQKAIINLRRFAKQNQDAIEAEVHDPLTTRQPTRFPTKSPSFVEKCRNREKSISLSTKCVLCEMSVDYVTRPDNTKATKRNNIVDSTCRGTATIATILRDKLATWRSNNSSAAVSNFLRHSIGSMV